MARSLLYFRSDGGPMSNTIPLRSLLLLGLLSAGALLGCAPFGAPFVFSAPTFRGISVPIPPPSLAAEPVQDVDIDGSTNLMDPVPQTLIYLYEHRSDQGHFVFADDAGDFKFTEIELDLTNNCIQVWFEEPGEDGTRSEDGFYQASIAEDDQAVDFAELQLGCP